MSSTSTAPVRPKRCQISPSISASDSGCSLRASSSRCSSAASSPMAPGYMYSGQVIGACAALGMRAGGMHRAICALWWRARRTRAPTRRRRGCSTSTGGSRRSSASTTPPSSWRPRAEPDAGGDAARAKRGRIRMRLLRGPRLPRDDHPLAVEGAGAGRAASTRSIGPVFNVRFEVDEPTRLGSQPHRRAAQRHDARRAGRRWTTASDVDLVVGLVTPLNGVATSAHSVGFAAYLSRHFVLRGMDDEQEFRAFEREFTLISGGGAAAALRRPQGAQGGGRLPARVGTHARPDPPRGSTSRS